MIGIPLGLLTANALEWGFHKYVLHGLGKNKRSFWNYHWHEHHKNCRKYDHNDPCYERSLWGWHAQSKEVAALLAGVATVTPLAPVAPFFVGTLYCYAWYYYRVHKKAHLDPEWAKAHLTWHFDHHMAPDQDTNWCVVFPFTDHLLGTRTPYFETARWEADEARKRHREAAEQAS